MSDALNYLIKTRPETISHYFAFLKQTGTHLDPKTRNLISVITKVYAQTDRGFRQYLGRALREGCTPMEVLDALLMAFPALGLAKITWAVDIILDMNIPGFDPDVINQKAPAPTEWRDVMASKERQGRAKSAAPSARVARLFVYRQGKTYPGVRQPLPAPEHRHP
jgi:alkylhydroperoxidase/carboxymuconolactone decarboxylase family protein YurZ